MYDKLLEYSQSEDDNDSSQALSKFGHCISVLAIKPIKYIKNSNPMVAVHGIYRSVVETVYPGGIHIL